MGRHQAAPLDPALFRAAFAVDPASVLISTRTGEAARFERDKYGGLMVRLMVDGAIRRVAAPRLAWLLHSNQWPTGPVKLRRDGGGYGFDNLVMLQRGQNPFAVGQSALRSRRDRDAKLLQALALNPNAAIPVISRHVGMSETCACHRLGKLGDLGLCSGPKCDARARWRLTETGLALAQEGLAPPDVLDRAIMRSLVRTPARIVAIARSTGSTAVTVRRRLAIMAERALIVRDEARYRLTDTGRWLIDADAPQYQPWLKVEAVSAASAKDVEIRRQHPNAEQTPSQRSAQARATIAGLRAKGSLRFVDHDRRATAG